MKYVFAFIAGPIVVALLIGACNSGIKTTVPKVNNLLQQKASRGRSSRKIEAVLKQAEISFSFNDVHMRYSGIIRDPVSWLPENFHAIVIDVYVDEDSRYQRHEVRDSYTFL